MKKLALSPVDCQVVSSRIFERIVLPDSRSESNPGTSSLDSCRAGTRQAAGVALCDIDPGRRGENMATVRETTASCEEVWSVLSDGWSYATWVVGASRIRAVDPAWPSEGSKIHHSVGVWPAVLSDYTRSLGGHDGRELELEARAMPFGKAHITLRLTPLPTGCRIEMIEDALTPPFNLIPDSVQHVLVHPRNTEALRRLALLAERSVSPG